MSANILRIATRKSPLALWQANYVKAALESAHSFLKVELVGMLTEGDKLLATSLAKIGGKGLFVKELEKAMLLGRADIAVHSIKDLPAELPEPFTLAAICEREDPRDVFISNYFNSITELPKGAKIGTSSLRRGTQLKAMRPDLIIETLRGNVGTRLQKLDDGKFDAIILAAAGIKRLGEEQRIRNYLEPEQMLPAVGQGAVGIECRKQDKTIQAWLSALNHFPTQQCIMAERAMNKALGGSCQLPVAAYAQLKQEKIYLRGLVAHPHHIQIISAEHSGAVLEAEQVGKELANKLLAQGAAAVIEAAAKNSGH